MRTWCKPGLEQSNRPEPRPAPFPSKGGLGGLDVADLKQIARDIFRDTLAAIDIPDALRGKLARAGARISAGEATLNLADYDSVRAVAIGKAAVAMAKGLAAALAPDIPVQGILVAPHETVMKVPGFRAMGAGHPLPDAGSLAAARAILEMLASCDARTLVFFLLSGGGSALVELPLNSGVPLGDVQELYRLLIACGAPIDEINAVRKHLSAVKGGRLAAAAPAATKVTLGVSDVPYGRESALASGPTLPDPTTAFDARQVVERYALIAQLPAAFREIFEDPAEIPETPKPGDPVFARSHFVLLLGSDDLLKEARRQSERRDCVAVCDDSTDDWPIAEAADYLLARLTRLRAANPGRRVAVIADGEVSSPVIGGGVGGRNSAFVLDCVEKIAGTTTTVLSAGTDGKDGSSPAAGAVADGKTAERARAEGLDPSAFARESNSYNFFRSLGDAVETGPTGNNLRDLRILLAE
jgi:glycerate 2-kinase